MRNESESVQQARLRLMIRSGQARTIRQAAGVSLPAIGRDIGTSHSTVWRWENGLNAPTGEAAAKYLDLLDQLAGLR